MLKHFKGNGQLIRINNHRGVTLVELMVALVISLIASSAMVLLMANMMGTGTQTIQMSRLTQDLRTAMQLMTRDLRRANYHTNSANCFAEIDCNPDESKIMAITPVGGDCFRFYYDHDRDDIPDARSFQWFTGTRNGNTVNVLQLTDDGSDNCGADWGAGFDITDPDTVNITAFTVSNVDSYNESVSSLHTQDVSKIRLTMTAELLATASGMTISKTIEDLIYVRNKVFCPAGTCPAP